MVVVKRRDLIQTAGLAGVVMAVGGVDASGQGGGAERKFTKCLSCGAIGVGADQKRAIGLAVKHGFESVEASAHFLAGLGKGEMEALKAELKASGLVLGNAGLPVDFRKDAETFKKGLGELPALAAGLQRAGVTRMGTWLMPCHDELTYLANFKQHTGRLREVAKVLEDFGVMLGFEYVGTTSLIVSKKYPFLHTLAETRELCEAIGTDNVGFVLDSWHWWQAGDSAEAVKGLRSGEIALVDLNDAPEGVAKQQQQDLKRALPMATGVIDVKPFLEALVAIGYDGPVRAEPFSEKLNDLGDDLACATASAAMDQGFALVGG